MITQGEIESAVCKALSRFQQDYMGRGPKDIRAHLIGDLLLVRLSGVLTAAEQHLVRATQPKGRELLKQVRTQLIETARPALEAMVESITGVKTLSLHHDISTLTGEEIVVFTLACRPAFREIRARSAVTQRPADRRAAGTGHSLAGDGSGGESSSQPPFAPSRIMTSSTSPPSK